MKRANDYRMIFINMLYVNITISFCLFNKESVANLLK